MGRRLHTSSSDCIAHSTVWKHVLYHLSLLLSFSLPTLSPPSLLLQNETREMLLGFNMVNYRACKNLWKTCVEHHTFFRLDRPVPPQKNFFAHYFTLGSKFRYW